jgi:hypothetical protein
VGEAGVHGVEKRKFAKRKKRYICIGTTKDRTEAMIVKFRDPTGGGGIGQKHGNEMRPGIMGPKRTFDPRSHDLSRD